MKMTSALMFIARMVSAVTNEIAVQTPGQEAQVGDVAHLSGIPYVVTEDRDDTASVVPSARRIIEEINGRGTWQVLVPSTDAVTARTALHERSGVLVRVAPR